MGHCRRTVARRALCHGDLSFTNTGHGVLCQVSKPDISFPSSLSQPLCSVVFARFGYTPEARSTGLLSSYPFWADFPNLSTLGKRVLRSWHSASKDGCSFVPNLCHQHRSSGLQALREARRRGGLHRKRPTHRHILGRKRERCQKDRRD